MNQKIVFTGGGTAGHVMPNIALFPYFRDYQLHYIGSNGMEKSLISAYPFVTFHEIPCVKLVRSFTLSNLLIPLKLLDSVGRATDVLSDIKPSFVFSKGGFVGLPVAKACKKLGVPLFLHESDKSLGLANKLAKKHALRLFVSFEGTCDGAIYTGSPLRQKIYQGNALRGMNMLGAKRNGKPFLLFVCGSSGAKSINDFVFSSLNALTDRYNIIHLTGKNEKRIFQKEGYYPISFCDRIEDLYALSSFVVTRGGANALSELIALKKLCVCIPLEKGSRGDQVENADYYESKGALIKLMQDDLSVDTLFSALALLDKNRQSYTLNMQALKVDGTLAIVENLRKSMQVLAK